MKKTGIMGGTFNPIHNGHIYLAKCAKEYFKLDNVLFMPTGNSYMKTNVLNAEHRVNMTRIAIENEPNFELSTIEADMPGNSYTYKTLQILKDLNKDTEYYFITGADAVMSMGKWLNPQLIFNNCVVVATTRNDYDMLHLNDKLSEYKKAYNADIRLFNMTPIDISSTDIREYVKNKQDISAYVPKKVLKYIEDNKLYQ